MGAVGKVQGGITIDDSKISSSVKPTIECDHLVPNQKGIEYDASVK